MCLLTRLNECSPTAVVRGENNGDLHYYYGDCQRPRPSKVICRLSHLNEGSSRLKTDPSLKLCFLSDWGK